MQITHGNQMGNKLPDQFLFPSMPGKEINILIKAESGLIYFDKNSLYNLRQVETLQVRR